MTSLLISMIKLANSIYNKLTYSILHAGEKDLICYQTKSSPINIARDFKFTRECLKIFYHAGESGVEKLSGVAKNLRRYYCIDAATNYRANDCLPQGFQDGFSVGVATSSSHPNRKTVLESLRLQPLRGMAVANSALSCEAVTMPAWLLPRKATRLFATAYVICTIISRRIYIYSFRLKTLNLLVAFWRLSHRFFRTMLASPCKKQREIHSKINFASFKVFALNEYRYKPKYDGGKNGIEKIRFPRGFRAKSAPQGESDSGIYPQKPRSVPAGLRQ